MKIRIQPVPVFPSTATVLQISGANIKKFAADGSATIMWQLLDDGDAVLTTGVVDITGSEYQGWNEDSPYLENIVLDRLNLLRELA